MFQMTLFPDDQPVDDQDVGHEPIHPGRLQRVPRRRVGTHERRQGRGHHLKKRTPGINLIKLFVSNLLIFVIS
jgi:hypothetical protein